MSNIEMTGAPYRAGDVVMVRYGADAKGVDVGRHLSEIEAYTLNRGQSPWVGSDLSRVWRPAGKVHFWPNCQGVERRGLARSWAATTCLHCLMRHARFLRGWRWLDEMNAETVAIMKERLRDRVAGFGDLTLYPVPENERRWAERAEVTA
jgi:hypothetical protein